MNNGTRIKNLKEDSKRLKGSTLDISDTQILDSFSALNQDSGSKVILSSLSKE